MRILRNLPSHPFALDWLLCIQFEIVNERFNYVCVSGSFLYALHVVDSNMEVIVASIRSNNIITPLQLILNERSKRQSGAEVATSRPYSIYRDMLFLSIAALGRDNIDNGMSLLLSMDALGRNNTTVCLLFLSMAALGATTSTTVSFNLCPFVRFYCRV